MGPKLDFSAGVPHNFFIYLLIAPKLHQKVYIDTSLDQDKENFRSRSKVKVKWAQSSIYQTVYRINFSFTDRLRPNSTRWSTSTPAWLKAEKIPGQDQRSRSNGPKTWFFRRCTAYVFYLPTGCVQTQPENLHRHQLGSKQRKFQVKVKGQGQIGQELHLSEGVPHNFFIYEPIAPKRHQKKRIDTSLDPGAKPRQKVARPIWKSTFEGRAPPT